MSADPLRPRRRPRTGVLVGGAIVVAAAVVLAIVLPLTLGSDGSNSPRTVAKAWGNAVLHHDTARARALSCPSAPTSFGVYGLVFEGTGMRAGQATPRGPNKWSVPLTTVGPGGGTSITVTVERTHGDYLVC